MQRAANEFGKEIRDMPVGHLLILLLLLIKRVRFGLRVELSFLVLLTWVFFGFVIKRCVVDVTFPDTIGVAGTYHLDESIL